METNKVKKKGRLYFLLILAVCIAPVVASYFTYYVVKPTARTNYGDLLDPRNYPMPQLGASTLDGKPAGLDAYKGKWIMLEADAAHCGGTCEAKLFNMRLVRLLQGKEMDRIERVWLLAGDGAPNPVLEKKYEGTHILRVSRAVLQSWLPAESGADMADYIYIVDPLGNLIMRFPKNPDLTKMKKDIYKLLSASSIG